MGVRRAMEQLPFGMPVKQLAFELMNSHNSLKFMKFFVHGVLLTNLLNVFSTCVFQVDRLPLFDFLYQLCKEFNVFTRNT